MTMRGHEHAEAGKHPASQRDDVAPGISHGSDCGHGHLHDHAHGHDGYETLIDEPGCCLRVMEHGGQIVASYRIDLDGNLAWAKERLGIFASGLADAVYARGGIVGHIKAFAREQGASVRISVTLHDPDMVEFDGTQVHVEGVAIVYGVERAWYERECRTRIAMLRRHP
jgi:hypothetical protein